MVSIPDLVLRHAPLNCFQVIPACEVTSVKISFDCPAEKSVSGKPLSDPIEMEATSSRRSSCFSQQMRSQLKPTLFTWWVNRWRGRCMQRFLLFQRFVKFHFFGCFCILSQTPVRARQSKVYLRTPCKFAACSNAKRWPARLGDVGGSGLPGSSSCSAATLVVLQHVFAPARASVSFRTAPTLIDAAILWNLRIALSSVNALCEV